MPSGENPKSKENLKKGRRFTEENAREMGKRGHDSPKRLNSISLRQKANEAMSKVVGKDKDGNDMTLADAMISVLADEAVKKRNMKAWELLRDTSGQKPIDKVMVADVNQETIDEVEKIVNDTIQE